MTIPAMQRAMAMPTRGAAPEMIDRNVGTPEAGEVLVRVTASSLNYHDVINLEGMISGGWPRIPLSDGAGSVVALGPGVTELSLGDRVMGAFHPDWLDGPPTPEAKAVLPGDTCDGWLQQYRVAATSGLVATPEHLTDIEAATLPCAGVTAWNALIEANIGAGDVVVTQGTGGVSLFTVQFARALGADVVLTSSSDGKLRIGKELGATHLVNYRANPDWEHEVRRLTDGRGAKLVVDLGGTETLPRSVRACRVGGTVAVVGVLTGFDPAALSVTDVMLNNIRVIGITVGSVRSFVEMSEMISHARIRPHISHVVLWSGLATAASVMKAGEHVGKIAITIE